MPEGKTSRPGLNGAGNTDLVVAIRLNMVARPCLSPKGAKAPLFSYQKVAPRTNRRKGAGVGRRDKA